MPSYAATVPDATALARATEALSVAADALAAALDATPDDDAQQPSVRAWLTTALNAVGVAHDAAEVGLSELERLQRRSASAQLLPPARWRWSASGPST